jgi:hypothetical protein
MRRAAIPTAVLVITTAIAARKLRQVLSATEAEKLRRIRIRIRIRKEYRQDHLLIAQQHEPQVLHRSDVVNQVMDRT